MSKEDNWTELPDQYKFYFFSIAIGFFVILFVVPSRFVMIAELLFLAIGIGTIGYIEYKKQKDEGDNNASKEFNKRNV